MPQRDQPPWWNADDDAFADATPLFEDEPDAEAQDAQTPPLPPLPPPEPAGTPIGEALRLAAALAEWSNQSGLTDTLKELAAEAAEALAEGAAGAADTVDDQAESGGTDADEAHDDDARVRIPLGMASKPQMVCDYCPLCRSVDVMRDVQPQVSQGLAEAMASLTAALNVAIEGFAARNRPR